MRIRPALIAIFSTAAFTVCAQNTASDQSDTTVAPAGANSIQTNAPATSADTNSDAASAPAAAAPAPVAPVPPPVNSAWQKAMTQEFSRASTVMGKEAKTARGESLGTIKDVAFNQQGQIFILVDVGEGRLAPLPWHLANLAMAKGRPKVLFNLTGAAVREAPIVTNDQWGELDNPNFTEGIMAYYRDQAAATATSTASAQGQGSSTAEPAQQTDSQQ